MQARPLPLIFAGSALLILCLTGCEGGTTLVGTIADISGNPIASAMITLEVMGGGFGKAQEPSNAWGAYSVHINHYPERTYLVVTVSKAGFELFKKKFRSNGTYEHLDVILKAAGPTPALPTH